MSGRDASCGTCRWWGGRISGRVYDPGPCRRYPPTAVSLHYYDLGKQRNVWPIMSPDDFCGEHQPHTPKEQP